MVFKFGIFSGNIERYSGADNQGLINSTARSTSAATEPAMFKFESKKIKPVADLPSSLGSQPYVKYSTIKPAAAAGGAPIGTIPASNGYHKIVNLQKLLLTNDGRYCWQKFGRKDTSLVVAAMALVGACYVTSVFQALKMTFKK